MKTYKSVLFELLIRPYFFYRLLLLGYFTGHSLQVRQGGLAVQYKFFQFFLLQLHVHDFLFHCLVNLVKFVPLLELAIYL